MMVLRLLFLLLVLLVDPAHAQRWEIRTFGPVTITGEGPLPTLVPQPVVTPPPPVVTPPVVTPPTTLPPFFTPPPVVVPPSPPVVVVPPAPPRDTTPFRFPGACRPGDPDNPTARSFQVGEIPGDYGFFYATNDGDGNPSPSTHTCAGVIARGSTRARDGAQRGRPPIVGAVPCRDAVPGGYPLCVGDGADVSVTDLATRYARSIALTAATRAVSPGGSQTMSKAPARFVEGAYPAYLAEGRGARVWDVDGNEYIDYICGLGAVPLGHKHPAVDARIALQLSTGLLSASLPTPLEEEVAAKLVRIIPCARDGGQVRFVKTGSEACAAAVRIARRATGREHVIVVGYHGWHDWVMQTAEPHPGVPVDGLVYRLPYNDLSQLEAALLAFELRGHPIAAVMVEPTLLSPPVDQYLQEVVALCRVAGVLCIFDEMVTGFRWATAGGQAYFGVTPDLAVFGKGLANGMPLACIVGPERLMRYADVISGTFGGEALSLAAASAVLDVYAEPAGNPGHPIYDQWHSGATFLDICAGLDIPTTGYPVHPKITFAPDVMPVFLQETARRGLLFHAAGFNISAALTHADLVQTEQALVGAMDAMKGGATLHGAAPRAGAFART